MLLKNKSILLMGQVKIGLIENLEIFLKTEVKTLAIIGISSPFATQNLSHCRIYHKSNKFEQKSLPSFRISSTKQRNYPFIIISYLTYCLAFIKSFIFFKQKFNLYIGISTFSALFGIIAKKVGLVGKVIYYDLDFYPNPNGFSFKKLINIFFRLLEPYVIKNSDYVWDLSSEIGKMRQQEFNIKVKSDQHFIVPIAYPRSYQHRLSLNKRQRWTIGFVGSLSENQGLQLVISAFPKLLRDFPKLKLRIIGHGTFATELQNLVNKKKLKKHIEFYGFIADEKNRNKLLAECVMGLAPYTGGAFDNASYTEPGKPKLYCLLGLPIVITNKTSISKKIAQAKIGKVILYNEKSLIVAIRTIISSDKSLKKYFRSVYDFQPNCISESIYRDTFNKM